MHDVTRRGFIGRTSIGFGAVALGGLAMNSTLGAAAASAPGVRISSGRVLTGPMVVHVRDVGRAEMSLMVGTQEFVYEDAELVGRLVAAAQTAAGGRARKA